MNQRSHAIEVGSLVKVYGTYRVVNQVSLQVHQGEIFGILGPNGAGKTTLLETVVGLRQPTSGRVQVLDMEPWADRMQVASRLSIQPQHASLFDHLTVAETLELFGSFYESPLSVDQVVAEIGLETKRTTLVKRLSGGQKQRLLVGVALVGNTDILFLDEPTSSLDPKARRELWDVIRGLRNAGKTVVMTTHSMEEAEALCDRLTIMVNGQLSALGSPSELILQYSPEQMVVYDLSRPPDTEALRALPGAVSVLVTPVGGKYHVRLRTSHPDETIQALFVDSRFEKPKGFRVEHGTMEDVFLQLVNGAEKEGNQHERDGARFPLSGSG